MRDPDDAARFQINGVAHSWRELAHRRDRPSGHLSVGLPHDHRALRSLPIKHDGHGIYARRRMPRAARHTQRGDGASLARRRKETVRAPQLPFLKAPATRENDQET